VEDICKNAFVSRKTFYTYFTDKFDLIDKIFEDDVIASMYELRELLPMRDQETQTVLVLERFYQSFYNNKDFYTRIVRGKGQYWFRDRLVVHISNINTELTQKYANSLPQLEREYMSYFFAASQAMLLFKWLQEGCERLTPRELALYYAKWAMFYWNTLVPEDKPAPPRTTSGARRTTVPRRSDCSNSFHKIFPFLILRENNRAALLVGNTAHLETSLECNLRDIPRRY
jgi:AcrR family transcriptional regulator